MTSDTQSEPHRERRVRILSAMQEVMGELPDEPRRVPLAMRVLEEEQLPFATRQKITFAVEENDCVPAYLFLPHSATESKQVPGVLCLHQTTSHGKAEPAGLGGKPNLHYALHLASRGYVALAPDYPNFGEYVFDPYKSGYASATMKGIWNHMRAVDVLQCLPQVASTRIGCIGHSLGGHNTLFLSAFDERVQCLVSNCGFSSFASYDGTDLSDWSHNGYMPRIALVYNNDAAQMPFEFSDVLMALAPRAVLAIAPTRDDFNVAGARDCISKAQPVYDALGASEKLAARHPDCEHDFPVAEREAAYDWLDRWLKP